MQNIKKFRKARGWSLQNLADKCDTSKTYIWQLENQPELTPSCEKVGLIATAFCMSIDYLFYGESNCEYSQGFADGITNVTSSVGVTLAELNLRAALLKSELNITDNGEINAENN